MSPWLPSLVNHPNVFNVSLTYHTDNRIFERTLVDLTCLNLIADKINFRSNLYIPANLKLSFYL